MVTKPRIVPPALTLGPEANLLTEFALIATSPQSPLVREVSGENADSRRREDDSPPPQLVDPKKMVCDGGLGRAAEAYPKPVPVPFSNHDPGCVGNTYEILDFLRFAMYGFITKERLNCFEKCF